jgi:hypothetical protein
MAVMKAAIEKKVFMGHKWLPWTNELECRGQRRETRFSLGHHDCITCPATVRQLLTFCIDVMSHCSHCPVTMTFRLIQQKCQDAFDYRKSSS